MENPDVKTVAPCEGTGYEIGSMSIVKGAKNLDNAKKFYDFALTPAAQELGAKNKQLQVPSNRSAKMPDAAPKLETIKLIDYDFRKYGSSAERRRLLSKWDAEVKSQPK
jgi:iron(III) transport system substrate-binding protein